MEEAEKFVKFPAIIFRIFFHKFRTKNDFLRWYKLKANRLCWAYDLGKYFDQGQFIETSYN